MILTVNEKTHDHRGDASAASLIAEIGANPTHSALTVNGELIPSKKWDSFQLEENDILEVLTFVGGG